MGKGGFIRRSEEACSAKARFTSEAEALQASRGAYRAYACPICHEFHLTKRGGKPKLKPNPAKPDTAAPAQPDSEAIVRPIILPKQERGTPSQGPGERLARIATPPRKDGRAILALDGGLVKSEPVTGKALRSNLAIGQVVSVTLSDPPQILRIEPA